MTVWCCTHCRWTGVEPRVIERPESSEFWGERVVTTVLDVSCPRCGADVEEGVLCTTCHERPVTVDGTDDCATCHSQLVEAA